MSENQIVSLFCKSSDSPYPKLSRRFHKLSRDGKQKTIELIQKGVEPETALRKAKREVAR